MLKDCKTADTYAIIDAMLALVLADSFIGYNAYFIDKHIDCLFEKLLYYSDSSITIPFKDVYTSLTEDEEDLICDIIDRPFKKESTTMRDKFVEDLIALISCFKNKPIMQVWESLSSNESRSVTLSLIETIGGYIAQEVLISDTTVFNVSPSKITEDVIHTLRETLYPLEEMIETTDGYDITSYYNLLSLSKTEYESSSVKQVLYDTNVPFPEEYKPLVRTIALFVTFSTLVPMDIVMEYSLMYLMNTFENKLNMENLPYRYNLLIRPNIR